NRSTDFRDSTIKALQQNGLNVAGIDDRLLLKSGPDSNKSARREQAAARYGVLLYFGDNLRDFSEEFKVHEGSTTIDSRKKQVDERSDHWGGDWIVLPNSSYGEWESLLKAKPLDQYLPPTAMPDPEKKN